MYYDYIDKNYYYMYHSYTVYYTFKYSVKKNIFLPNNAFKFIFFQKKIITPIISNQNYLNLTMLTLSNKLLN